MEEHQKSVGFECLFCLETFLTENLLEVHMKNHTRETSKFIVKKNSTASIDFKCESIKSTTSTNIKTFGTPVCCQCQEEFSGRTLLKIHYKNVHTRKLYSCDLCTSWYLDQRSLNRHMRMAHLGIVPNPKCEECNLSFADTNLLWSHKKIVHLKNLFKCSICMKTYTALRSLQRHQRKTQHLPSKFHPPETKVKTLDDLEVKKEKLIATTSDSNQPINYDGNSNKTKLIKIEKPVSRKSAKMMRKVPIERTAEFPVMLRLIKPSPYNNYSYPELLKSQQRDEAKDMFFLHLNRY